MQAALRPVRASVMPDTTRTTFRFRQVQPSPRSVTRYAALTIASIDLDGIVRSNTTVSAAAPGGDPQAEVTLSGTARSARSNAPFLSIRIPPASTATTDDRFRIMADTSPLMMWTTDATGNTEFVNRAWCTFFGVSPEHASGMEWQQLLHPEDAASYMSAFITAIHEHRPFHAETRVRRCDGEWRWIASFASPRFASDGSYLGMVASSPDITDRVVAEEKLRHSEENFRVALQSSPILVCRMDRNLRVTWMHNPAGGLTAEDVLGRTPEEVLGESGRVIEDFCQGVLRSGRPARSRLEIPARDIGIWDGWAEPQFDASGEISGVITAAMNVTELVHAQRQAEEANDARDRFLSMIAHDLRTPLTSLIGWSSLLSAGLIEPDLLPVAANSMQTSARLLQKLVDELLDLTRLINRRIALDLNPLDLVVSVREAVTAIRPAAVAKGLEIAMTVPDTPIRIAGDAGRLQQILGNLLSNAVKFTDPGGCVDVTLASDGRSATVVVRDTGRGIEPAFLPRVFERFAQQKEGGGLGLGLAIVKELVEHHGGNIVASSEGQGRGAGFTVTLPLLAGEADV